jgi:hypothetical protein
VGEDLWAVAVFGGQGTVLAHTDAGRCRSFDEDSVAAVGAARGAGECAAEGEQPTTTVAGAWDAALAVVGWAGARP